MASQCKEEEGQNFFSSNKLETILVPLVIDSLLIPNSELAPPTEEQLILALKSLDIEHKGPFNRR